jgi:hypothetical protein
MAHAVVQQPGQVGGVGELGRLAKAAMGGIEVLICPQAGGLLHRARQRGQGLGCGGAGGLGRLRLAVHEGLQDGGVLPGNRLALVTPGRGHRAQQVAEGRAAIAGLRRVIGATVEGHAFRREEDGQGPATALAGEHLVGLLVDLVQVGALFAVDLDVDEELVHLLRRGRVVKRLVGHHVAPVAGRIADRQQNGLVAGTGQRQGGLAPGVPVHRLLGVLQQVGRGFLGELVGHGKAVAIRRTGHGPRSQARPWVTIAGPGHSCPLPDCPGVICCGLRSARGYQSRHQVRTPMRTGPCAAGPHTLACCSCASTCQVASKRWSKPTVQQTSLQPEAGAPA